MKKGILTTLAIIICSFIYAQTASEIPQYFIELTNGQKIYTPALDVKRPLFKQDYLEINETEKYKLSEVKAYFSSEGYFKKLAYKNNTNHFDVIVFKSMLGIINSRDLQAKAIKEMHKALKAGGELFFAENLTASPVHQYLRRRFVRWGKLWRYVSIDEMKEFLSPFSNISLHAVGVAGTLGRSERQRNALGIFDKVVLDHITPNRWKYILLGVARK